MSKPTEKRATLIRNLYLAFVGAVTIAVVLLIFAPLIWQKNNTADAQAPLFGSPVLELHQSSPVRLIIPHIGVDASIEQVGVAKDGSMGTPKDPEPVGWLNISAEPGDVGNAIIDGHSGWKNHRPAAFDRLKELRAGDTIIIVNADGENVVFTVASRKIYLRGDDASDAFATSTSRRLTLITCTGDWDFSIKNYKERLVVVAYRN